MVSGKCCTAISGSPVQGALGVRLAWRPRRNVSDLLITRRGATLSVGQTGPANTFAGTTGAASTDRLLGMTGPVRDANNGHRAVAVLWTSEMSTTGAGRTSRLCARLSLCCIGNAARSLAYRHPACPRPFRHGWLNSHRVAIFNGQAHSHEGFAGLHTGRQMFGRLLPERRMI